MAIILSMLEKRVDRLFDALPVVHGKLGVNPVTAGTFVWGVDPIAEQKKQAIRLLRAREEFARIGPPDAPPLPLSEAEIGDYRNAGGLKAVVGFFARSIEANEYDFSTHPPFEDFARGLMACNTGLWGIENNETMKKRFPPRHLEGMGPGLYWEAPRKHKRAA